CGAVAAAFFSSLTIPLWGQAAAPTTEPARNPLAGDPTAITQGAVLFRQECMFCHGVGARGGMRGPDLTTGSWTHGGSDADLVDTIKEGVPGTAMPPHNLTPDEIWRIIAYLRTLEQAAAAACGHCRRRRAVRICLEGVGQRARSDFAATDGRLRGRGGSFASCPLPAARSPTAASASASCETGQGNTARTTAAARAAARERP